MNRHEAKKTAVGYIRVSSEEQIEGLSLESQEAKITEWCDSHCYELVKMYRDEGVSAYTDDINRRPALRELMDNAPHLRPDAVVVYSLDRWARNLTVASKSVKDLDDLGIAFASCTESTFDFSDPVSRMQLHIFFTFAEHSSAMTSKKVRHVNDLKFEKGFHRGPIPFGYRRDPIATKGNPLPPIPDEVEFAAVQELFTRALTGTYTCAELAVWLNARGFRTRNRQRSEADKVRGGAPQPRKFTLETVQDTLTNSFYAGFIVREKRKKNGTATEREMRQGLQAPAVSPEDFNRTQAILKARYKAPRSRTRKLRRYVSQGILRCWQCGEKAYKYDYYRESSAFRGIACDRADRCWPANDIDRQWDAIVQTIDIPAEWRQRALELAMEENGLIDLQNERVSLERRHRRHVELYKDDIIDRAELDQELQRITNRLRTLGPVEVSTLQLTISDFARFSDDWRLATPTEKNEILRSMIDRAYLEFRTGQIMEVIPKPGYRFVFEATGITKPPGDVPGDLSFVIGDPDGDRGKQQLTASKWGGLSLRRVMPPLSLKHVMRIRPRHNTRVQVSPLQKPLF